MQVIALGMLGLTLLIMLGGCVTTEQELAYLRARSYDRSEVDAINAEAACKLMARTLVQISRCETRR